MGVWSPVLKNKIIYEDGSVQKITEVPDDLKAIYKYVHLSYKFHEIQTIGHVCSRCSLIIDTGLFGRSNGKLLLTWPLTVVAIVRIIYCFLV